MNEKPKTIGIMFLYRDFEHDIYELIRAFYPGWELFPMYDTEQASFVTEQERSGKNAEQSLQYDLFFMVCREGRICRISWKRREPSEEGILEIPAPGENVDQGLQNNRIIDRETGLEKKDDSAGYSAAQASDALLSFESRAAEQRMALRLRRKEQKDRIKQELYVLLKKLTGRDLPWGDLTGIRPVKLAMGYLEQGMDENRICSELRRRYFVSPEKAVLAARTAMREKEILDSIDVSGGYSLYVGIPFCPSICLYCSFSSFSIRQWESRVEDYLQALFHEMDEVSSMMRDTGRRLDTLYIGGGTPTTLSPDQLRALLSHLEKTFGFGSLKEFTVEAGRPDSITADKLLALKEFPVSRISVNPQTMNRQTLELIGRRHTPEQTIEAFRLAREAGFDNINMDIIIGLPGEGKSMVENTLGEITALGPDSLTVHTLAVKRAARLNIFRDRYSELDYETSQEIMDAAMEAARGMSMSPYYLYRQKNMKGNFENVGYAKVDKAGIYNILIMEERQPIVALGASGASKLLAERENRIERVENVKDVDSYIRRIDEMILRKKTALPLIALNSG